MNLQEAEKPENGVKKHGHFSKQLINTVSSNLKLFWKAMGGKDDIAYKNCQVMPGKLGEINIKYIYYEYPGGHTWPVWRDDLYIFAP